jgi:hypothetical protein
MLAKVWQKIPIKRIQLYAKGPHPTRLRRATFSRPYSGLPEFGISKNKSGKTDLFAGEGMCLTNLRKRPISR